jgi:hypothetical protein
MQIKPILNGALFATLFALLATNSAHATNSAVYNDQDWLLGFYSNNQSNDFVVDIGPHNPNVSFTLLNTTSHIGSDLALSTAFGASWFANSVNGSDPIYYAVIETNNTASSLELTNPDPAEPWMSSSGKGGDSNAVKSVGLNEEQQPQATGQTSVGLIQAKSLTGSWFYFVADAGTKGPVNGDYVNDLGNGDYGDGGVSDVVQNGLEFDFIQDVNSQPAQVALGTFSLDSAGDLTYTAAPVTSTPEPSAIAAIGMGAVMLTLLRRRPRA